MKSHRIVVAAALVLAAGCARLIGADFDGAQLGSDAGGTDAAAGDVLITDDAAADVAPDAKIDPKGIGDLELWLRADRETEIDTAFDASAFDAEEVDARALLSGVSVWRDQSGHAHDGVQLDPLLRPLRVAPPPGIDAGPVVVRFDRARRSCFSLTWTGASFGQNGATLFVVSRGDIAPLTSFEAGTGDLFFPWDTKAGSDAAPELAISVRAAGARATARLGYVNDALQVSTARVRPGVYGGVETWHDGTPVEKGSLLVDATPPLAPIALGCAPGEDAFADGDVVELLVYGEALSDDARAAVEKYLRTTWGL